MSATYGHPATEALVATLAGTEHDTGLDIHKLESIAAYFREVRKKYHAFEGQLKAPTAVSSWPRCRAGCSPTSKAS
jgi:oxaloacetate decarboxylase alpha subunit